VRLLVLCAAALVILNLQSAAHRAAVAVSSHPPTSRLHPCLGLDISHCLSIIKCCVSYPGRQSSAY